MQKFNKFSHNTLFLSHFVFTIEINYAVNEWCLVKLFNNTINIMIYTIQAKMQKQTNKQHSCTQSHLLCTTDKTVIHYFNAAVPVSIVLYMATSSG